MPSTATATYREGVIYHDSNPDAGRDSTIGL